MHNIEENYSSSSSDTEINEFFIGSVKNINNQKEWFCDLKINNKLIDFKTDTGAQANCIPVTTFKKLNIDMYLINNNINTKLTSYSGIQLDIIGGILLKC